tara:strand:+ start:1478 stop:1606 length:129 start_codon:yes stop_codon:yes gene_type:complete
MIIKLITYIAMLFVSWGVLMIMIYMGLEIADFIIEKWSNYEK